MKLPIGIRLGKDKLAGPTTAASMIAISNMVKLGLPLYPPQPTVVVCMLL